MAAVGLLDGLHLGAWHALEHVHLDLVVEKANLQIQRAIDLVDKYDKDNDAVAIRKEAAVAVVGLLDIFHLGVGHAFQKFHLDLFVEFVMHRKLSAGRRQYQERRHGSNGGIKLHVGQSTCKHGHHWDPVATLSQQKMGSNGPGPTEPGPIVGLGPWSSPVGP